MLALPVDVVVVVVVVEREVEVVLIVLEDTPVVTALVVAVDVVPELEVDGDDVKGFDDVEVEVVVVDFEAQKLTCSSQRSEGQDAAE